MEKLLSVVVPAYNAENCLERCVSSLLLDRAEELEIILVDDGSTDRTGELADQYVAEYPKTVLVIHKENGGHGSGINAAVQKSRGRFFRVVDADDCLISENLSDYLDELRTCDADVVINGFYRVLEKRHRKFPVEIPPELWGETKTLSELKGKWEALRNCFTIHGITYRRECYMASQIRLTEKVFYEDNEYTTLPFCRAERIYFSPYFLYLYFIGNENQSVSDKNQLKRLDQLEKVLFRICEGFRTDGFFPSEANEYILEKLYTVVNSYLITCLLRESDRNRGAHRAEKIMERMARDFPSVYQRCITQYQRLKRLHAFHFSGRALDTILDSKAYLALKQMRK